MGARGAVRIESSADAAEVLRRARAFLRSRPVEHNLVLTLLEERAAHPQPGRFWSVLESDDVIGVLFQSPLDFHSTITPVLSYALPALVAEAAAVAPSMPGITGEAATAALFAGCWAEVGKIAAVPDEGERLYELGSLTHPNGVAGTLRCASLDDEALVISWLEDFAAETGTLATPRETMRRRIAGGLVWIWNDDGPVAMAAFTPVVAGVSRIGAVFTPHEHRRRGYAAACTAAVTQAALDAGADRCILYTQLANPQSNAIYRRLGYRPVQELIHYRFG